MLPAPLLAGRSGFAEIGQGQFFGFERILQRDALLILDSAQVWAASGFLGTGPRFR